MRELFGNIAICLFALFWLFIAARLVTKAIMRGIKESKKEEEEEDVTKK